MAKLLVPLYSMASTDSGVSLSNTSREKVEEVILTNIAPPKLVIIDHQKLIDYLIQSKCKILFDDKEHISTIWTIKL